MKILEIVYGLASGGAERLVVDLCNDFSKEHEVTLLVLKDVEQFYASQVSKRVNIIYAHFKVGKNPSCLFKVIPIINRINPDVIHYHSQARYILLLANIIFRNKYKFFMTFHSDVALNYTKGISGLQVRLAGFLGNCRYITISKTNETQFHNCHPHLSQMMINNGRELPLITEKINQVKQEIASYKRSPDTTVFIHVARFNPCKNQETLINVFNELYAKGIDLTLIILGAGFNCEEGKQLQAKACCNIHFLGVKENVYDYLSCADAFCLSSQYEGMPISLIEASLSGLPIISTPVCGAVDIIKNDINGILTNNFTPTEYEKAILHFIRHKKQFKEGAITAMQNSPYSISECAKKHIQWFNQ